MESFTPEQHERYEQYRRSAINRNTVRKVSWNVVFVATPLPVILTL